MDKAFVDLHCHTNASFDCLSAPKAVVRAADERGLTHLAITDHDRIDGALEAQELAPSGLTILIGEEVKTRDGDLICVFLERAIAPGMSAVETIAAAREQGALVGIPHPYDRLRGSLLRDEAMTALGDSVDWVETHNARLVGRGNERAVLFAGHHALPGVAVSDAHSILEIGVAYTALEGDISTAAGLRAALTAVQMVPGRASFFIRAWTPVAKIVQRARGNRRVLPPTDPDTARRGGVS
jgi:predicted metal-dependent phosphoesterase TrpH